MPQAIPRASRVANTAGNRAAGVTLRRRLLRMPWPRSLWPRLALLLLAGITPLLALLYVAVSADAGRVVDTATRRAVEAARLGADQQQAMLQNTASLLHLMARMQAVQAGAGPACGPLLLSVVSDLPAVAALAVTDARGTVICGSRPRSIGLDLADRPFFQQVVGLRDEASYVLSELTVSRVDGKPSLFIGVPLPAPAGTAPPGIAYAVLNLDWFAELRNHLPGGDTQVVQVMDSRDGAVLARIPNGSRLTGLRFPDYPVITAFRASPKGGSIATADLEGEERIFGFASLRGQSGGLLIAVGLSLDAVRAETDLRTRKAMGVGLAVAAIAVLLSYLLAQRTLVRPLRALSAAAARLGSGDLSSTAEIEDSVAWELRALAGTFGRMAKRLKARDSRIEAMQLELAASEAHHRLLADAANDMITRLAADLLQVYVSPACRDLLGYEPEELIGRYPQHIVHPEDREALDATLIEPLLHGQPTARATYRAIRGDGGEVWLESSGRSLSGGQGFVLVTRDVTERKALEDQLALANRKLQVLVRQDGLTGLANRRRFDELLAEEHRRVLRGEAALAVIMLDVDRFKLFNDTYGHPAGDGCLQAVARAIEAAMLRPRDVAARYGGEEFAVLLPNTGMAGAREVAERIQSAIRAAAMPHAGSDWATVTVSMGLAAGAAGQTESATALVGRADAALYSAKHEGRNRIAEG